MEYKKLMEVATIRQGRHYYPALDISETKKAYLLRSGNLVKGMYCPYPPFTGIEIESHIKINTLTNDDILLCHMGSNIGKVSVIHNMEVDLPLVCNQTITIIRPTHINSLYLYAYLSTYVVSEYCKVSSKVIGSTTGKYIAKNKILGLPILIPSAEIQNAVATQIGVYAGLQKKAIDIKGDLESNILSMIKDSKK